MEIYNSRKTKYYLRKILAMQRKEKEIKFWFQNKRTDEKNVLK